MVKQFGSKKIPLVRAAEVHTDVAQLACPLTAVASSAGRAACLHKATDCVFANGFYAHGQLSVVVRNGGHRASNEALLIGAVEGRRAEKQLLRATEAKVQ